MKNTYTKNDNVANLKSYLSLFGISGFVVGPVIAALFLSTWEMFAEENEADELAIEKLNADSEAEL